MSKDVAEKAKEAKPKTNPFKKIGRFFKDLRSETKKIVWPTKKQVLNNTGVVFAFLAVSAVVILCLDLVFTNVMKILF